MKMFLNIKIILYSTLTSKHFLPDCFRGELTVCKFEKRKVNIAFQYIFKNPRSTVSLIYHCHFGAEQLTAEIKLTNGET